MLPWLAIMTNKDGDGSTIKNPIRRRGIPCDGARKPRPGNLCRRPGSERLLGVGDREMREGAKGMPEKQALAWWISHKTTVARRWVGEQLRMGDESRVSQAIRRINAGRDRTLANLKARLERAEKANDNS